MYQASCVNAVLHDPSEFFPSVWFTPFVNWFSLVRRSSEGAGSFGAPATPDAVEEPLPAAADLRDVNRQLTLELNRAQLELAAAQAAVKEARCAKPLDWHKCVLVYLSLEPGFTNACGNIRHCWARLWWISGQQKVKLLCLIYLALLVSTELTVTWT